MTKKSPKQERSAGAVVFTIDKEKTKFLLLQNTLKRTYWEFPKGKIEKDETIEETIKREIKEETGLDKFNIIPGFKHVIKWFFRFKGNLIQKEAVYLLAEIPVKDKDKAKMSFEHQKIKWMNFEEAEKEINIKSNREMLEKAHEFIKEFKKQKRLF